MVKEKIISNGTFVVAESDFDRLQALVDTPWYRSTHAPILMALREALAHANVVPATHVPKNVVTMRSRVRLIESRTGNEMGDFTLVYPEAADLDSNKISVLAPMGLAMLGSRAGLTIKFDAPAGPRRLKIDRLLYQPEASGDFHL